MKYYYCIMKDSYGTIEIFYKITHSHTFPFRFYFVTFTNTARIGNKKLRLCKSIIKGANSKVINSRIFEMRQENIDWIEGEKKTIMKYIKIGNPDKNMLSVLKKI